MVVCNTLAPCKNTAAAKKAPDGAGQQRNFAINLSGHSIMFNTSQYMKMQINAQQSAATCQFELQASSSSLLAPSLIHVPIRCAQHHFSFANRQIAKYRRFSHGNQPSIVFINLTHCLQTPRTTVIPCLFAKIKVQQALPPSKFCFKGLEHGIGMHLVYFQLQRKP